MTEIEAPNGLGAFGDGRSTARHRADRPLAGNGAQFLMPLTALAKSVARSARAESLARAMPYAHASLAGGPQPVTESWDRPEPPSSGPVLSLGRHHPRP